MSLWSRMAQVFRGDRCEPRDRRRTGVAHRRGDRAGARTGGGPARVRLRAPQSGREPRRTPGRLARFAARRRGVRLAAADEEEGDFGGRGAVAGARDRGLHLRLPADRRAATAAAAGEEYRTTVRPLSRGNRLRRQTSDVRRLGVSVLPTDARRRERRGGTAGGFLRGADGSDLSLRPGNGEGVPAIRFRGDVRLVRTAARRRAAFLRKTTI